MTERTRRATDALAAHYEFLDGRRNGSTADRIEGPLLDPARDPSDPRYGHEEWLYEDADGTFQGWIKGFAGRAQTFAATIDLMREVELSVQMLDEEGIDFLPLLPHHVPARDGFILFPYGIENPYIGTEDEPGVVTLDGSTGRLWKAVRDVGGGDRCMIDGLLWTVSDRVSKDGHAGEPVDGLVVLPLTRYRGRNNDRPFRLAARTHPGMQMPSLVASDVTAWAFDEPGQEAWIEPALLAERYPEGSLEREEASLREYLADNRRFVRSLIWATFRWLSEEVWINEDADRAAQRRMKRARPVIHENTPQDGDVVIVDLRTERKEALKGDGSGEPPWWRSRWIVRGHWARRRAAILDGNGNTVGPVRGAESIEGVTYYYKRVWIEPFVKGPDSAPLVYRERVGVLNR